MRFAALAFGPDLDPMKKVTRLAASEAFATAVRDTIAEEREVFDSRDPATKYVLSPTNPVSAARYFYAVRSNLSHRGKGAFRDAEIVRLALIQLEAIIRDMLDRLRTEAANEMPTREQRGGETVEPRPTAPLDVEPAERTIVTEAIIAATDNALEALKDSFRATPTLFYAENDLVCWLACRLNDALHVARLGLVEDRDGLLHRLVHTEYPTPFHCRMEHGGFEVKTQEECRSENRRYKRGHLDVAIGEMIGKC